MQRPIEHSAADLAEKRLKAHIAKHLPNATVWLFGSRAQRSALRRSDFDLAVDLGTVTSDAALIDFEESIRDDPEIIYPVDIVDLRLVPEAFRANIRHEGILWKN